ncbi:MAG: FdrA family protein [Actinomycetes bacterium]
MTDGFDHVEIRTGAYYDSVSLMQVSAQVTGVPGVRVALVAMATELNLAMAADAGFTIGTTPGPADLLIAIRAADQPSAQDAVTATTAALEALTARRHQAGTMGPGPLAPAHTTGAAVQRQAADLALVSVPGRYAFAEAMDALEHGVSVMVFSDNVPAAAEVRLKAEAASRGLLVLGPDAGTAVIGGVGLGFANVVQPGPVGIVAASGTGAQHLMCLLDEAGVGITGCLGVGGRDLSAAVGAATTLEAMTAFDADPATQLIVVVSKPADPVVAATVRAAAATLATPVLLALLGEGHDDLSAVAERAVEMIRGSRPSWPVWTPPGPPHASAGAGGGLRGLFVGGTLADEAMVIAAAGLGRIDSNIPLRPGWALGQASGSEMLTALHRCAHWVLDLGEDRFTQGRPHPMIDPGARLPWLTDALEDPGTGVVLLDLVLGHGSHPDPAGVLAPTVAGTSVPVLVSLVGTAADPQDRARQITTLTSAGAEVFLSNAAAARRAVALIEGSRS